MFPGGRKGARRGFSPSLILPKRIHRLYRDEIENVRANPRFAQAVWAGTEPYRALVASGGEPWFAKYIGDLANTILEQATLYLYYAELEGQFGGGATLGKLQLIAFTHGFASPRRVSMYVKRMVQIGRLGYSVDESDRRVRRLVPKQSLIDTAFGHYVMLLDGADVIWPGRGLAARARNDKVFFRKLMVESGSLYIKGADPMRPFSEVRHFTSKDAGTFLLNSLVVGCLNGKASLSDETVFAVNYSDIAKNCGVSRTHVRNVLETAAERGLVVISDEGGRNVRLTRKFIDSYEQCYACLMIMVHHSANIVLDEERKKGG